MSFWTQVFGEGSENTGVGTTLGLITGGFAGAALGGIIGGSLDQASNNRIAANRAAEAQRIAIAQQEELATQQYNQITGELDPYKQVGLPALSAIQDFQGLNGQDAYQSRVNSLVTPEVQYLQRQGEEGILRNAAATGGLRGGNTQAALSQYSPALIQQLIQQRIAGLGGLVGIGQNATQGQIQNISNYGNVRRGLSGFGGQVEATRFQNIGAANNVLPGTIGQLGSAYLTTALNAGKTYATGGLGGATSGGFGSLQAASAAPGYGPPVSAAPTYGQTTPNQY